MRTRRILASPKGNALVLAVLLLLAMTSVGLVSVQRTNSDLQVAGNVVRSVQAQMAGESGISRFMADLRKNLYFYLFDLKGKLKPELDPQLKSTAMTADVNQCAPIVLPSDVAEQEAAQTVQGLAYKVEGIGVDEISDMPGYEVGEVCFEVFDFNAEGGMPSRQGETVDETLAGSNTVVVRYRARVVVGPTKCMRH